MHFTKLRLSGFKSFVQPTELLIEPGLTGVVGPNGCGKSNLVEAIRWVMGESSARGLRGGEMEDVIFAGTAARPAYDLAEVILHLNGESISIPGWPDQEEVELCRRIGRGTGSAFRVNGKEVRARDVQLLFADVASGARSAAIIRQGQVGALVEAKPPERRRLLEDAAGIGGLQARRHEAELRLQAAENNLARLQDLLVELGEQRERLRKQARQAARYRDLSATYRETEAALLAGRWQRARVELAAVREAFERTRQRIGTGSEAVSAARAERDRLAAGLPALRQAEADAATESARLAERLDAAARERARLQARETELGQQLEQIGRDVAHARGTLEDARGMLQRQEAERSRLASAAPEGGAGLQQAEAEERRARAAAEAAEAELRRALGTRAQLEARARQLEVEREQAAWRLTEIEGEERQIAEQLAGLGPGRAAAETEDVAATAAETGLASAIGDGKAAEEALAAAEARREATAAALRRAEQRSGALRERLRELEQEALRHGEERERLEERRRDLVQRLERLDARQTEISSRIAEREARQAALGLVALEAEGAAMQAEVDQAVSALADATAEREAAEERLSEARAAEQELRNALERARTEAEALAEIDHDGAGFPAVLDQLEVQDGYADALAAALGDDLLASLDPAAPAHWLALAGTGAQALLPVGCAPLSSFVRAPAALAGRLAQVGVVEAAAAAALQEALAQGQRLVSPNGGLWRWDGLVRQPDASRRAAARVHQQGRRRALEEQISSFEHALSARREAVREAEGEAATKAEACAQADALHRAKAAQLAQARETLSGKRAASAALAAELSALAEEAGSLAEQRQELEQAHDGLTRQGGELVAPDDAAGEQLAAELGAAEAKREVLAREDADAGRAQADARTAAAQARERIAAAQAELERQSARARVVAAERREQAQERARLEAAQARLAAEREALTRAEADRRAAAAEVAKELDAAGAAYAAAETASSAARAALAEAAALLARLHDHRAQAETRLQALSDELTLWQERARAAEARVHELLEREAALRAELATLPEQAGATGPAEDQLQAALSELGQRQERLRTERETAEARLAEADAALARAEQERAEAREAGARLEAQLERALAEHDAAEVAWRTRAGGTAVEPPPETPSAEELAQLEERLARAAAARERLGPVNLHAVDEAAEVELRCQTLETERDELTGAIERLRRAITALNREGRERLRAAFVEVERHFEALFVRLFGGGQARLSLTDLDDPLAAGLELAASPPGKKLQSVSLLSGGEKALTALALLFAVFLTRPSPLCVLDEIDAPLDDANVDRLVGLLEEVAQGTQTRFIVITHHPVTMARMHRLYGVTMLERGVSQLVSVDLEAAVALRATA